MWTAFEKPKVSQNKWRMNSVNVDYNESSNYLQNYYLKLWKHPYTTTKWPISAKQGIAYYNCVKVNFMHPQVNQVSLHIRFVFS